MSEKKDPFKVDFDRVKELRKSPSGKYRVLGIDRFSGEDWVQGEYDTAKEAIAVARKLTNETKELATDFSVATVYYAYDPDGKYLGGDTWNED